MSSNNTRVPAVPLLTCDPYFSLWSPADCAYDACTCHWTGTEKRLQGRIIVDGTAWRFLGSGPLSTARQTVLTISPTASAYRFEAGGVSLDAVFRTPLLLEDPELISRPCSYVDFAVASLDAKPHQVKIALEADEGFCYHGNIQKEMLSGSLLSESYKTVWMGQKNQRPIGHSGDDVTIDWGTMYIAAPKDSSAKISLSHEGQEDRISLDAFLDFGAVTARKESFLVLAYDDIISIMYFSHPAKGFWARNGRTFHEALKDSIVQHGTLVKRCESFDTELQSRAVKIAGESYSLICSLAYRQTIAAHKLIEDENGKLVFLSKECFSNGCIGTVDISYPSAPLYLLYQSELVAGMLRPVFRFSNLPVWPFDFAPHDVGRYPYATGQVYSLLPRKGMFQRPHGARLHELAVYPAYYGYPAGNEVYDEKSQMPVEECGNMLILTAAYSLYSGKTDLAADNISLLEKWCGYLVKHGADPGDQLCTDDFAGHLAHNINLAGKAVMGIAAYSILLGLLGKKAESARYMVTARQMAAGIERRAEAGDRSALVFGDSSGWSLKYNMIWDKVFGTKLFSGEFYKREINWYIAKKNKYGTPLDSRSDYTKSDWVAWAAAMTDDPRAVQEMMDPVALFLKETPDRVPFSDFYDTMTAIHRKMQNRSVQGGLFMPILANSIGETKHG